MKTPRQKKPGRRSADCAKHRLIRDGARPAAAGAVWKRAASPTVRECGPCQCETKATIGSRWLIHHQYVPPRMALDKSCTRDASSLMLVLPVDGDALCLPERGFFCARPMAGVVPSEGKVQEVADDSAAIRLHPRVSGVPAGLADGVDDDLPAARLACGNGQLAEPYRALLASLVANGP